jgi:pimeloyl-ACP methyl ester carboxylesterase
MPKVHANGIDIYYESRGTGSALILIAGFGCDHTIWSKLIPGLARHNRVITFDNRGMGQSTGADTLADIRQMAEDAAALIDGLALGSAHVVGHSMGGMIAQELALARPQLVQTLSLLSSCTQLDERGKAIIESWGELPRQVGAATATKLILPWLYTNTFYARPKAVEQIIELVLANPFPPTVETIYRQSRAISAFNSSERIGAITCPTLVAVGSEDVLLPVQFSELLAHAIRGAQLRVLENTGHGMLIESPELVTNAIAEFLRGRK